MRCRESLRDACNGSVNPWTFHQQGNYFVIVNLPFNQRNTICNKYHMPRLQHPDTQTPTRYKQQKVSRGCTATTKWMWINRWIFLLRRISEETGFWDCPSPQPIHHQSFWDFQWKQIQRNVTVEDGKSALLEAVEKSQPVTLGCERTLINRLDSYLMRQQERHLCLLG